MIRVEAQRQFDPGAWRDLVARLNGTPLHLPEILLAGSSGENLVYLLFRRGHETVGASVGVRLEKSYLKVLKRSKTLRLPTPPVVSDGCGLTREHVLGQLIAFSTSEGYKTLEVDPRWGEDFGSLENSVDRRVVEFVIDLNRSEGELLKAMHQKHRKNIRKSLEAGLTLAECTSVDDFLNLRVMQQASSEKAAEKGNRFRVLDQESYAKTYRRVYQDGPGKVLFAKAGNEYVAGLAYLAFGKNAITVRSGSTSRGYGLSAMYLLQYELMRNLKARGFKALNIGGVPAEAVDASHEQHGLYNYKRYYGGTACLRTGLKVNL